MVYLKLSYPDLQAVAQTVLDALEGEPAIVLAHGDPLLHSGDAARVQTLLERRTVLSSD